MKNAVRRCQAVLAGSILLLSGAVNPSSWEPETPPRPFHYPVLKDPQPHPWIALTFDDGPHPVMTERLMAVLRHERVPGTFFVVGKMADRYPQVVREMARDGDEVDNHTYTHPRLPSISNDEILSELSLTRSSILRLTGRDSVIFRPPGGKFSRRTLRATSGAGYHMVLWNVLTNDFRGATQRMIYRRIIDGAQDGSIVLMHSGMKNTIDVLPEVIAKLREEGYHFVTVSELLKLPPSTPHADPKSLIVQTAARSPSTPHTRLQ